MTPRNDHTVALPSSVAVHTRGCGFRPLQRLGYVAGADATTEKNRHKLEAFPCGEIQAQVAVIPIDTTEMNKILT